VRVLAYSNTGRKGNEFEYGSFADARTDAEGTFRLTVITPGPAVFWLLPEKYAPSTHAVKDNKRGDLGTFTLAAGLSLSGKVVDAAGKPLAGVIVQARRRGQDEALVGLMVADHIDRVATTDAKGEFALAPLPPGAYDVQPQDRGHDNARERPLRRPLPAVFVGQKVVLKDGEAPAPLEVRAVPHVVIEARYLDGKGKPGRGHECFIFGRMDGAPWHAMAKPDADGKLVARVPHGLEEARVQLMTNEHGVLRWRKGKDGPLSGKREIDLGTLNEDVKGIELIHYKAPILVVNGVDARKQQVKDFKAQVVYAPGKSPKQEGSFFVNGVKGDVYLQKQKDGRWRSSQLLPDEELTVTVSADGYAPSTTTLRLAEGQVRELDLVLQKKAAPKDGK